MSESESNSKPSTDIALAQQCSPDRMATLLVDGLIVEKTGDLIKDGYSFSIRTIFKLLLLLSLGEIKGLITKLLTNVIPMIKQSPIYALMFYSKLAEFRSRGKTIDYNPAKIEVIEEPTNHVLNIDANEQFVFSLYGYINSNPRCQFTRSASKIGINNLKDRFVTETISKITVGKIRIIDSIDYDVSMLTGEPVGMAIASAQANSTRPVVTSYIELFDKPQQEMLKQAITYFQSTYSCARLLAACTARTDRYTELDIAKLIITKNPGLDLAETCYGVSTLLALNYLIMPGDALNQCRSRMQVGQRCFWDPHNDYVLEMPKSPEHIMSLNIGFSLLPVKNEQIRNTFRSLFTNHKLDQAPTTKPEPKTKIKQLTIEISHEESAEAALTIAKDFVDDVCKYQRSNSGVKTMIKIYCLLLETQVAIIETPNPEYEQWEEQKKMMDEYRELMMVGQSDAQEGIAPRVSIPSMDFTKIRIPPKKISTEKASKVIVNKLLNETSKSIDTLYLRKMDMDKLLTSLDQFHNKKEILADLGLPNKLNILLYGEPGTGKSTAIQAIATYLGRNIYYLDLKNAVTNQDLQMMFEYVNKNVQNGGIIVIEDIDAMTDIVLKRESVAELRVNQLVSSGDAKLSLEYLLNILQGTLTLDDSIFIVTTNHIDHLDPAFYRDGRFDVKVELKLSDHYQIQSIYHKFLNRRIPDHLIKRIPEDRLSPATVIFHVKDYLFATDVPDEVILARFMD